MTEEKNIILVSNSNTERGSHFVNKLTKPLNFCTNDWVVGVRKLMFRNTLDNILNESITIKYQATHEGSLELPNPNKKHQNLYYAPMNVAYKYRYKPKEITPTHIKVRLHARKASDVVTKALVDQSISKVTWFQLIYTFANDDVKSESRVVSARWIKVNSKNEGAVWSGLLANEGKNVTNVKVTFWHTVVKTIYIPPAYYFKAESLTDTINDMLKSADVDKFLTFSTFSTFNTMRVVMTTTKDRVDEVRLSERLSAVLGFKFTIVFKPIDDNVLVFTATESPSLDRGHLGIYITSNIVPNILVGTSRLPLLDVVCASNRLYFGESVCYENQNPIYHSVLSQIIDEIEVQMVDQNGKEIVMDHDSATILVLHFKQT